MKAIAYRVGIMSLSVSKLVALVRMTISKICHSDTRARGVYSVSVCQKMGRMKSVTTCQSQREKGTRFADCSIGHFYHSLKRGTLNVFFEI